MIKYPNGTNNKITEKSNNENGIKYKNISKSHLGIDFETMINESNIYYLTNNIACIYKKPTPIQVVKVSYPSRNKAKITEAFYKTPSTTDYNGIYKGMYIDFETKSCQSNSFSFSKIYDHQIKHLETVYNMGGVSFLLIEFSLKKEIFLLPTDKLIPIYKDSLNGGRKSIPYEYFLNHAIKINIGYNPIIDYLKAVDILINEKSTIKK